MTTICIAGSVFLVALATGWILSPAAPRPQQSSPAKTDEAASTGTAA